MVKTPVLCESSDVLMGVMKLPTGGKVAMKGGEGTMKKIFAGEKSRKTLGCGCFIGSCGNGQQII